jgi:hypothetical protein
VDETSSAAKRARGVTSFSPSPGQSTPSAGDSPMPDPGNTEPEIPLWYSLLSKDERQKREAAVNKAWDMVFFVHGLSFSLTESKLYRLAIAATKRCPAFKPCCRQTLAGSHLSARDVDANLFKAKRLSVGQLYGFLFCSDGWRNKRKRSYHNYILISTAGPIFLSLSDHTGLSGTAQAIHDEVEEVFSQLEVDHPGITLRIVIGCTDTPSANRSSWKLLRLTFPRMIWMGCMAHELGLLFKDWGTKIPELKALFHKLKQVTIWIRNHGDILLMFEAKVRLQWPNDKRKHKIGPYMPGDTRMATVYKLLDRTLSLKCVFESLVTDPAYVKLAQASIKAHNTAAKPEHRVPSRPDGTLVDYVRDTILNPATWSLTIVFQKCARSALYLHRMVDTFQPCLGKVYYYCAITSKHLAMLAPSNPVVELMKGFFGKRWARWHNPIHTLAYALDPSFQSHQLTAQEKAHCKAMLAVLRPGQVSSILVELNSFKSEPANFDPDEWRAVDTCHGYQWWHTFGDCLPGLQSVAIDVLSKAAAASACEFNWSAVSSVERKGRSSLLPASTNATINVAANHKLQVSISHRGVNTKLPTLDGAIEDLVMEVEDDVPMGVLSGLEEVVQPGLGATSENDGEEEEEEEHDEIADRRAQASLFADWGTRDLLLSAP